MTAAADDPSGIGGRREVARFLAEHEKCNSRFDVQRDTGTDRGRVVLTCAGCGEQAAYDAGEPGVLKLIDSRAEVPAEHPPPRRSSRDQVKRWLPRPANPPRWLPNSYIIAMIVVGLAMVAVGGLISRDRSNPAVSGGVVQAGERAAESSQPISPVVPPPLPAGTGEGAAEERSGPTSVPERDKRELDMVTVLNRFSIGVPPGWSKAIDGGAVVLLPSGREAELRVFLEPGQEATGELKTKARDFLTSEHPGAKVGPAEYLRLGGDSAILLVADYKGGTEHAALLSEAGYSYLLLSRVDDGAAKQSRSRALAALYSFRVL